MSTHTELFFSQVKAIAEEIDFSEIEKLCKSLKDLRDNGGRLFFLGVGGSAAHCSHAVNDFRKLCGIESYTPIDNVSELSARINDDGWETSFSDWLSVSKLNSKDAIFIMSVGGGNIEKGVSMNIVSAINYAINLLSDKVLLMDILVDELLENETLDSQFIINALDSYISANK